MLEVNIVHQTLDPRATTVTAIWLFGGVTVTCGGRPFGENQPGYGQYITELEGRKEGTVSCDATVGWSVRRDMIWRK